MDFIEFCRKIISFDSSPSQGNEAVARCFLNTANEHGYRIESMTDVLADQTQLNIIISPPNSSAKEEFLFQTHLDTTDPGPYGLWSKTGHNPFDAHIIDGKIYGLGAADVKLDFACKLEALKRFPLNTEWKIRPVLIGTYGEEIGMAGMLKLIRRGKIKARRALVGEPSDLHLIHAGKGMASVEIHVPFSHTEKKFRAEHDLLESSSTHSKVFNGRAAHSSTPQYGDSAIKKMFQYLTQLPEDLVVMDAEGGVSFNTVPARAFLEIEPISSGQIDPMSKKLALIYKSIENIEEKFLEYQDAGFSPSHPTLNIGVVRTSESMVSLYGNCRTTPSVGFETYQEWMNVLKTYCQTVGGEFRVATYNPPFFSAKESEFALGCLEELKNIGLKPQLITQPSTNEASLLSRVKVECLCFGPGIREGNIHTPHEHVKVEDLYKAVDFYQKIMERFCL